MCQEQELQRARTLAETRLNVATAKVVGASENYQREPSGENYWRIVEFLAEAESLRMELVGIYAALASDSQLELTAAGAAVLTDAE